MGSSAPSTCFPSSGWIDTATEALLRQILENLQSRAETVATAESCTGGLLATLLTELAGSSAVYVGGISAYSNAVKIGVLQVPAEAVATHGAVSAEVAELMASGVKELLGTTYAIALTGVAGPGGGRPDKPVGTVYCGIAGPQGARAVRLGLDGSRAMIRMRAASAALELLDAEIRN